MKRFGWLVGCLLQAAVGYTQKIDIRELTSLLETNPNKIEAQLRKKGFRSGNLFTGNEIGTPGYFRLDHEDERTIARAMQVNLRGRTSELVYQTSSPEEIDHLKTEIGANGYQSQPAKNNAPIVYQKQNYCIECFSTVVDTMVLYTLKMVRTELPRLKEIIYAEDLLQLNAQEYLAEVFGRSNIRADEYYFTPTEKNKCTVLFPNTNREVFIIWNDEDNMRDIAFVVIGGSLGKGEQTNQVNQVSSNIWRTRQGLSCGMTLRELVRLNKEAVSFFGWNSEFAGSLTPKNNGRINFDQLKLIFHCLNCQYAGAATDIIQSSSALQQNMMVFVGTMILMPPEK
jgi:hypothetical protein